MNYYLFVTGCQQNIYDAEKITHLLNRMGYFESNEKNANIIIVFACSVRQKPIDRIFGKLKIWKNLHHKPKIIVTGCILPYDKKKLKSKVNAIINPKDIETTLPKLLKSQFSKTTNYKKIKNIKNNFIPIMFGCNNFCAYCAVPYTRGREVSRNEKEIINEIIQRVKNGTKEICLLGQNVNSYKITKKQNNKLTKKSDFVSLLKKIEKIKDLKKISFLTSHPKDMSNELIDWMAKSKKFSKKLHLPLQSGDDKILKKMNRHYTAKQYFYLVRKLKQKIKNLVLTTDIIVGFPGETNRQFENTYKLCQKINFNKAYVSQFSPRPGTKAAELKDNIPVAEKKRRWEKIDNLINFKKTGR